MKNNRRGEVATITVLVIAGVALLLGTLAPNLNPFNALFGKQSTPDASKQTATWTKQTETRQPIVVLDKKGDAVAVGEKVELVYDTGADTTPVKLTFSEKVGNFFSGLTTWAFIFIVVSLVFFGGAPIVWLWRKYATMKAAFKNTVSAIREADEETFKKLKPHLEANHDKKDRVIVDHLKAELNK